VRVGRPHGARNPQRIPPAGSGAARRACTLRAGAQLPSPSAWR